MLLSTALLLLYLASPGLSSELDKPTPRSFAEWKDYTDHPPIQRLDPELWGQRRDDGVRLIERDRALDLQAIFDDHAQSPSDYLSVYSDVLLLGEDVVQISMPPVVEIFTRVLATNGKTVLNISRVGEWALSRHVLYFVAPTIQGNVSLLLPGTGWDQFELLQRDPGTDERYVGFIITFEGTLIQPSIEYLKAEDLDKFELMSDDLEDFLDTQLLVASVLFWTWPRLALDIAVYAQLLTSASYAGKLLYAQAQAMADWISTALAVRDDAYTAPALSLDTYQDQVEGIYDVVADMDARYTTVANIQTDQIERLAAWDHLVAQAEDHLARQQMIVDAADATYQTYEEVLARVINNFDDQVVFLAAASTKFNEGVQEYIFQQQMQLILGIAISCLTIAISMRIVTLPNGKNDKGWSSTPYNDIPPAAFMASTAIYTFRPPSQAIMDNWLDGAFNGTDTIFEESLTNLTTTTSGTDEEVETAATIAAFRSLIQGAGSLREMTDLTQEAVRASGDFSSFIPVASPSMLTMDEVHVLWDSYLFENQWWIDQCVGLSIKGAGDLLAETQKLTARGKLVATTASQVVKAGQELVKTRLDYHVAQRDLERLSDLRAQAGNSIEITKTAQMLLYRRILGVRTDLLFSMNKATQSFRYLTLRDSTVQLDPTRPVTDLQQDILDLTNELISWKEYLGSQKQDFMFEMYASNLGMQGMELIQTMKVHANHTGKVLLQPDEVPGGMAGQFNSANYIQIEGLSVQLLGVALKDGITLCDNAYNAVKLQVQTTGTYQNTREGLVFDFVSQPGAWVYQYPLGSSGSSIDISLDDSDWNFPTSFTEWLIRPFCPEALSFENFTDVKFVWEGKAYFDLLPFARTAPN